MANQDYTTWSPGETDPSGWLSISSSQIDFTNFSRNQDAYHVNDFGAGFFNVDFTHTFAFRITARDIDGLSVLWMLANDIDDWFGLFSAGKHHHLLYRDGDNIILGRYDSGGFSSTGYAGTVDTPYYPKIQWIGTALYCFIYADEDRTSLLSTLSRTFTEKSFRHLYGKNSYNDGQVDPATGWIKDLDLGLGVAGVVYPTMPALIPGEMPMEIPGTIPGVDSSGVWAISQ